MNTQKHGQKYRSFIISELSQLSKEGWKYAKPCDYEPLERELRRLNQRKFKNETLATSR